MGIFTCTFMSAKQVVRIARGLKSQLWNFLTGGAALGTFISNSLCLSVHREARCLLDLLPEMICSSFFSRPEGRKTPAYGLIRDALPCVTQVAFRWESSIIFFATQVTARSYFLLPLLQCVTVRSKKIFNRNEPFYFFSLFILEESVRIHSFPNLLSSNMTFSDPWNEIHMLGEQEGVKKIHG